MAQSLAGMLNAAFTPTRAAKPKPGTYIATNGDTSVTIEKRKHMGRQLWCVEIDGRTYSNSRLGDLLDQIGEFGFECDRVPS